jgi:hypothetical protein
MIEKGLIITGSDAELLSRALSEVKTKAYEEKLHSHFSPLRKRLELGTIIERCGGAEGRKT